MHCDWRGECDRHRVEEAAQEFEILWQTQHQALRVLTLPEAVHQHLIDLAAGITHLTEIDVNSTAPRIEAVWHRRRGAADAVGF